MIDKHLAFTHTDHRATNAAAAGTYAKQIASQVRQFAIPIIDLN